jgi:predicted anti-sigma-YlaC factor YlaD
MKMHCKEARRNISLALDKRLAPAVQVGLQEHLHACPSCLAWQEEQSWIQGLVQTPRPIEPTPRFYAELMATVAGSMSRPRFFPLLFRPALLRAAMVLLLIFSAVLGIFLGRRLEAPSAGAATAIFNQTMNLDAFTDLPVDSFGAVYERLLQGELQ